VTTMSCRRPSSRSTLRSCARAHPRNSARGPHSPPWYRTSPCIRTDRRFVHEARRRRAQSDTLRSSRTATRVPPVGPSRSHSRFRSSIPPRVSRRRTRFGNVDPSPSLAQVTASRKQPRRRDSVRLPCNQRTHVQSARTWLVVLCPVSASGAGPMRNTRKRNESRRGRRHNADVGRGRTRSDENTQQKSGERNGPTMRDERHTEEVSIR